MKLIRGLIIALLLCAVLISPVGAFQIYEKETYFPTENIQIGTEITSKMTLAYEPSDAALTDGFTLETDLKNPTWKIEVSHSNHPVSTRLDEGQKISVSSFDFYYSNKITEVQITLNGTIDKEESVFIKLEEFRDGNKIRNSYYSEPFYVSTQSSSPTPVTPPVQRENPDVLYEMLYPYQKQIDDLGKYVDVRKYQQEYDAIKANIDNYASETPKYTDKEIKSQIEGLKRDLVSIQRQAMESNLNAILPIISPNSQYYSIFAQMVEKCDKNDFSGDIITQSINLYYAVEEENANNTSQTVTTVALVIVVVILVLGLLLIIRNKNRKEREF